MQDPNKQKKRGFLKTAAGLAVGGGLAAAGIHTGLGLHKLNKAARTGAGNLADAYTKSSGLQKAAFRGQMGLTERFAKSAKRSDPTNMQAKITYRNVRNQRRALAGQLYGQSQRGKLSNAMRAARIHTDNPAMRQKAVAKLKKKYDAAPVYKSQFTSFLSDIVTF